MMEVKIGRKRPLISDGSHERDHSLTQPATARLGIDIEIPKNGTKKHPTDAPTYPLTHSSHTPKSLVPLVQKIAH